MIRIFITGVLLSIIYAVDYNTEIQPIFNSNCTNCHHVGSASYSNHQLDLTSYSGLMSGGESGVVVIPGNSNASILYNQISEGDMPPGGINLSSTLVELIAQWIDEGALFEPNEPLLGDINEDGIINILDVISVVNLVLSNEYDLLADVNEDESVDILDVVILVNIILSG